MLDKIGDLPSVEKEEIKQQVFVKKTHENFVKRVTFVADLVDSKKVNLLSDMSDINTVVHSLASLGEMVRYSWHRIAKQNPEYHEAAWDLLFTEALEAPRYKNPTKFFAIAADYGLDTKLPKTIAEKKDELTYYDILGNEDEAEEMRIYGFYERGGMYYSTDLKGKIQEISNFKMKIVYHVETSDVEAYRIIHIQNVFGYGVVIQMNTDDFVSIASFKKIIARKGNFIFKGSDADLCRLSDKLQRDEVKTELLKQLGYSRKYNVYAFANGVYDCNGKIFKPVDELGIVEHSFTKKDELKNINFFIPAMSKMFVDKDDLLVSDKRFILVQSNVSFSEWSHLFCQVYGDIGKIALSFYLIALFSDIVFRDMDGRFPLLNVYGQKGTGKGTMIESMMKLFGLGQKQLMLGGASTVVGMMRKSGQYSNAFTWLDEYKNNLKTNIIESIKNFYDRIGYERGKKDNSLETDSTRIDSACIVSGQEMPIIEEALFSRFIMLITTKPSKSEVAKANFFKLKTMEADGLSNITVYLLKHRTIVAEKFKKAFADEQNKMAKAVNNTDVDDRFINNYSALVAMCDILKDVETLPFNIAQLRELCKETLTAQFFVLKGSDAVGKWWNIIESLFNAGLIHENKEFIIKDAKLLIRVQDVYQLYAEAMQKRKDSGILDEATLRNYLENDPKNFVEKAKKFWGGAQRWCLIFHYEGLNVDLIKADSQDQLEQKYKDFNLPFEKMKDEAAIAEEEIKF